MNRITWPDGFYAQYDYDASGAMTAVRENGAASGAGVLARYAYDELGRRTSLTRGNGTVATYAFDAASRLTQMADNLAGATHDQTLTFSYNPAGQITQRTSANDLYAFLGHYNIDAATLANKLNQATSVGGDAVAHDNRGNLTAYKGESYGYTAENFPVSANGATLAYDATGRLERTAKPGSVTTRYLYAGSALIAEHDAGGSGVLRRYVRGASVCRKRPMFGL